MPDLYSRLLPTEIFQFKLSEKKINCSHCSMQFGQGSQRFTYRPDLKCCTYEPFLPNFYVGALLNSKKTSDFGRQALLEKIQKRRYALPIGLVAPIRFQVEFNARKEGEFGNREDWLCPYYDRSQKNCGVWFYRGAVCTTYFCLSSAGQLGFVYWEQMLDYMTYLEMALMEEALVHLDFTPRQVSDLLGFLNRKKGSKTELKTWCLSEVRARKLWNGYYEEQEKFYNKSFLFVKSLDKRGFREILGEQGLLLEENLLKTQKQLTINSEEI